MSTKTHGILYKMLLAMSLIVMGIFAVCYVANIGIQLDNLLTSY